MRCGLILSGLALAAAAAGCGPSDPLERPVSAPNLSRYAAWRAHLASDSGPELRTRVEEALQEIRLGIMGERELRRQLEERPKADAESLDEAVRVRIDRRPLREVLQLGYELRVRRLTEELVGLEDAMSRNARLVTKPGDLESRHHLDGLRDRQLARVAKYREDIAAAEKQLAPLVTRTGRRLLPPRAEGDAALR